VSNVDNSLKMVDKLFGLVDKIGISVDILEKTVDNITGREKLVD
jgi:hypothetical protein